MRTSIARLPPSPVPPPPAPVVLAAESPPPPPAPVVPATESSSITLPPLTHETVRTTCLVVLTLTMLMLLFETKTLVKSLVKLLRRRA